VTASGGPGPRVDPVTGTVVQVVASRQDRPNLPVRGCPFCVGGTESPEPYVVRSFPNRWPSFPGERCEVVLYGPEHGESLATLGPSRARLVVDLWAERTETIGARDDVAYVLCFENHGADVGATIAHPHGQLFAYPEVPPVPARALASLTAGAPLLEDDPARTVVERDGWRAWAPYASAYPHHLRLAPLARVPDLPSLDGDHRDALASVLVDVLGRMERAFDPPMPYLFWWVQQPTDGRPWPGAWVHLELVSPWRDQGVARYVAAGELGGGVLVNPVDPDVAAARLRAAGTDG
jgi:UDPglucose--hexose-1-phosphate uridylyltransferase